MRQVEIQAFSVEEAVRLALEQLGRTRDQVKVEVLATDPGSEEVLVRVTASEPRGSTSDEEVSPRRTARPGYPSMLGQSNVRGGERRLGGVGGPERGNERGPERRERDGNRADRPERPDRPDRPDRPRGGGFERGGRPERPGRWDRDRGPRAGGPPRERERGLPVEEFEEEVAAGPPVSVDLDSNLTAQPQGAGEHATPEDAVAPIAAEILQKILMGMRVHARIARRFPQEEGDAAFPDDQQSITLNITDLSERDQNTLIGRRGETVDAMQFLVNLIAGRQVDLWTRIIIDVENYRLRRKFALINLARRTADQVRSRRQAVPLEAMPAYERRIIHMALAEDPDVVTESTGMEPERRVVILPK